MGRAVSRVNFIPVDWYVFPTRVKLLEIGCLFVKRKFNGTQKDFSINYPCNSKCGKMIFSFKSFFLTKLWNTLAPNSLDKLMQLISVVPHIDDLDRDKINDFEKFLKKLHSLVLSWLFTFKDFESKNLI